MLGQTTFSQGGFDVSSRYKNMVDAARDAIVCANTAGKITYANPAAEKLFGHAAEKMIGSDLTMMIPTRFRRLHRLGINRFMQTNQSKMAGQTVELAAINASGTEFPIELSLSQYKLGAMTEVVGTIRDISVRKRLIKQLEERAATDYLTGLWNRQMFDRKLTDEWRRARRYSKELSLLMADLDNFKEYNDLFGHQSGDEVLKIVADILRQQVRSCDMVARYGGEEFVVILPEVDLSGAVALAERILAAVRDTKIAHAGPPIADYLTISIGAAIISPDDKSETDLLKRADIALYNAKKSGRDQSSTNCDQTDKEELSELLAASNQNGTFD